MQVGRAVKVATVLVLMSGDAGVGGHGWVLVVVAIEEVLCVTYVVDVDLVVEVELGAVEEEGVADAGHRLVVVQSRGGQHRLHLGGGV